MILLCSRHHKLLHDHHIHTSGTGNAARLHGSIRTHHHHQPATRTTALGARCQGRARGIQRGCLKRTSSPGGSGCLEHPSTCGLTLARGVTSRKTARRRFPMKRVILPLLAALGAMLAIAAVAGGHGSPGHRLTRAGRHGGVVQLRGRRPEAGESGDAARSAPVTRSSSTRTSPSTARPSGTRTSSARSSRPVRPSAWRRSISRTARSPCTGRSSATRATSRSP